jgi:K+-transporting ATPase ATPase A chain
VLAFSLVSVLFVYVLQRVQGSLPGNPTDVGAVPPALAFTTSVSFVSNTNWQNYAGENTVSHLTQMAGLAVQNFVSAAVGIAVAIALVRGLVRRRSATIGNFWVDLTRATTRILLPLSVLAALVFVSQGAIQNFHGFTQATTLEGLPQAIAGGPFASQESIKLLGTNGGGTLNANSAHPLSNPNGLTNWLQMFLILLIPFALTFTFGKLAKDRKQGWAVFAAMFVLWAGSALIAQTFEANGNPEITDQVTQENRADLAGGGNLEGKETRFGSAATGLFAATTTGTSSGAVDAAHDSFTPGGGAVPLVNMMLSEVSPGGVGAGLYGMLVFAILAVFIAGLMVGRTPEYLGKKIQAAEMKLIVLYLLAMPVIVLSLAAASVVWDSARASIQDPGAHGLSEVLYAFGSGGNNNGSAFAGFGSDTPWFNGAIAVAMLVGRFFLIIPAVALAGSLAAKPKVPESAGTFPTHGPLFGGLVAGVVLIIAGLTFFPALALGPIVEQLSP